MQKWKIKSHLKFCGLFKSKKFFIAQEKDSSILICSVFVTPEAL